MAEYFGSIEALAAADIDLLQEVPDVGPIVAQRVVDFFSQQNNRDIVKAMITVGITWPPIVPAERSPKPFTGQTFVLTGTLTAMSRGDAKEILLSLGAKVSGSVSAKTDYVIAGPGAGSKRTKAEALGLRILDEEAFQTLLRSAHEQEEGAT